MNRGFGFYFANAIKSSAKTLWHKGNLIKYFVWVIMEVLAPFTFILGAMFSLANVRQAKIAERENVIDIPQSFKIACKAKPFWTMFLATVLEALIFLAGVILIGIAGALLGAIGYAISGFVNDIEPLMMMLIFFAPGMIVLAVYSVIMPILFAPTAYIIETNPDIGAADAISICFNTMKSRGKATYFVTCLVTALITGAILGLGVAIEFVVLLFVTDSDLALVLMVLVGIIFLVGFALVAPMFALARKITLKSLFEDIVLDPVNASKRTSGVNIKKCKGVKFDPAEYENELSLLFDETYSDRIPVPETPAARRKRMLEERRAARAVMTASAANADYTKSLLEDNAPTPAPVRKPDDEDGELITVSDLIRDVIEEDPAAEPAETEAPAEVQEGEQAEELANAEELAQEEEATQPEPEKEEPAEEPSAPAEPVKEEEPAKTKEPAKTEEPVKAEEPEAEPVKEEAAEEPAEKPVKKAAKKSAKATKAEAAEEEPVPETDEPETAAKATKAKATKAKSSTSKTKAKKATDGEED